jgi:hypothetical protein
LFARCLSRVRERRSFLVVAATANLIADLRVE